MLFSSALGLAALAPVDPSKPRALEAVWLASSFWIALRAALGWQRIWPGIGRARLAAVPAP